MKIVWLLIALLLASIVEAQTPTGTVTGQVLGRDGQPAVGIRVSAMAVPDANTPANNATALVSIAMTDAEGRYRLENVLPGRYYILAGFVDLPTYYPGVASVGGATPLNVLSATPVTGINFTIASSVGVTVSGRVVRSSGTGGMAGQRVALLGGAIGGIQESLTTEDGSFQFLRVRPGTYQLTSAAGRPSGSPTTVSVGEKDITGLQIVIVPTVEITGAITIEGDAPRPRLNLQFAPFKGNTALPGASPQNDGTFRVPLPEGDYRVSWSNLPVGYEIKSVMAGSVDLLTTPLKVTTGSPPSPLKVVLAVQGKPWVKLAGRITGMQAGQTLVLSGPSSEPIQIPVKADGKFEIDQIFPGNYTARINAPIVGAQTFNQITIPSQDTTDFVIAMPPSKEIRGTVTNAAGAVVQARMSMNWSEIRTNGSASGSFTVASQADGRFSLNLTEGERRLTVSVPGATIQSFTYGATDLSKENMKLSFADTAELRVVIAGTATSVGTGAPGGGTFGGIVATAGGGFVSSNVAVPPSSVAASPGAINRIGADVAQANLVSSPSPVYPPLASAAQVQGTVVLQIEISAEGKVQNATVISGHPLLNDAAIQAVRQWSYKPFTVGGTVVPVVTTATVNFTLR